MFFGSKEISDSSLPWRITMERKKPQDSTEMFEKELSLITHLRKAGRVGLTELSRRTGIPVSTIFDRVQNMRHVTRFCALLNFSSLGYSCPAILLLKTSRDKREELIAELSRHPNINTMHRVNNGHDICAEVVFKNMRSLEIFLEQLEEEYPLKNTQVHYLLEEVCRERFYSGFGPKDEE